MNPSWNDTRSSIEWREASDLCRTHPLTPTQHLWLFHQCCFFLFCRCPFYSVNSRLTDWGMCANYTCMFACVSCKHLSFSSTTNENRPFQVLRPWVAHKVRSSDRFCNLAARILHFNADKQLKERTKNGMKIDWPNKRTDRFESACAGTPSHRCAMPCLNANLINPESNVYFATSYWFDVRDSQYCAQHVYVHRQ